ncbi:MAG: chromate transporter [Oscillospiraceae bacterium]
MNEQNVTPTKRKNCLSLFTSFFKIGAFTFGGGLAMIPLIQKEAVESHKWISDDELLEIVAIAESTPGPIAINSATFVGHKVAGFWGSLCATLGVVLPSFIIISIIARVLDQFQQFKAVQYAFYGIRAGVLALVLQSLVKMYKKCPKNPVAYGLMAISFIGATFLDINVLLIIVFCGIVGLVSSNLKAKGE